MIANISLGQSFKVTCSERERKNADSKYPDLIKTCFIKNYKFVQTFSTDNVGRYVNSEEEVYVYFDKKYIKTNNSKVFNKKQDTLILIINNKIQQGFKKNKSDSTVNECLRGIDSIPIYKMNDLEISFQNDEIQFGIDWGLRYACGPVNGVTVSFKLSEIEKYLR